MRPTSKSIACALAISASSFVVAPAFKGAPGQSIVVQLKEVDTELVEGAWVTAHDGRIFRRQLAPRVQTDFIQHAAKMHNPPYLIIRAAESGNLCHSPDAGAGVPDRQAGPQRLYNV